MKYFHAFIVLSIFSASVAYGQSNLLDTTTWTVGSGSVAGFPAYGSANENIRELDTDPHGNQSIIWKGIYQTPTSNGGWLSDTFPIDHTKTYRFTVWMKKINAHTGAEVFGTEGYDTNGDDTLLSLSGTSSANPIFKSSMPELDQWFLYVAFVHDSGHSGTSNLGGVYDLTGTKVADTNDFKFSTTSVTAKHRAYYWSGENAADELYFFDPTVYVVDGTEPTISELLNPTGADSLDPTAPTISTTGHTDTTVDLSWSGAADNVGVTGYKVYKDGLLEASPTSSPYTVTGLTAATTYGFTVTALDAAGNESTVSNAVSVTTDSSSGGGGGSSVWSENGSTASYTGEVAIGIGTVPSGYKLAVDGNIRTRELRVDQDTWPDYVFEEGYDLPSLEEIQKHINEKGHLPNIPSAQEVQAHGMDVGEMNKLLLEKIEELTLYTIRQEKLLWRQQLQIQQLTEKLGIEDNLNR